MFNLAPFRTLLPAVAVTALAVGVLGGCATPRLQAESIARAHRTDAWHAADAYAMEIEVDFGGQRMIDGTLTTTPDATRSRLDLADGATVVFDGERCWVSPADTTLAPGPRFHALTWPYFLAAPFKLTDPGTRLEDAGVQPLVDGLTRPALRLTFASGVGDAPDDWYLVFPDPEIGLLHAMAYIVTYGRSADGPAPKPSLIMYNDFRTVPTGALIAHEWSFGGWDPAQGRQGDKGMARLENIRPVTITDATFAPPAGAREDRLPGT